MNKAEMLEFIKENFFIDGDDNLQYRFKEDTPAVILKKHIEWLKRQDISSA